MKAIIKWIGAVAVIIGIGLALGGQFEALSIPTQSDKNSAPVAPAPEGFRAIAALEGDGHQKAERSVRTMSKADKVGQLMMIGVNGTTLDGLGRDQIHTYRIGGIVMDNDNFDTKQQVRDFTNMLKSTADVASLAPLFIAVDRGQVKLKQDLMVPFPTRPQLGRQSEDSLRNYTTRMAIEMHDLGFNLNLGPTMNTEVFNAYTADVDTMVTVGDAFAQSFKRNHAYVAYKYFPTGPDYGTVGVAVPQSYEYVMDHDGAVFSRLLAQTKDQTPMVLVSAISIPDMDALPVSLSKVILTDFARETLQFDGVIISDKIESGAAVTKMDIGNYAVKTILAGSDMVVVGKNPRQIQAVREALMKAVENGTISEERLNDSVRRIMYMKYTL